MPVPEIVPVPVKAGFSFPGIINNKLSRQFLLALITFFLVNVTWVFFRADSFDTAWRLLASMFGRSPDGIAILSTISMVKVTVVVTLMVMTHW